MEKGKSFPEYSSSFSGEFDWENRSNSYHFNGPCSKRNGFAASNDPELKRKKRIASYNVFTMEAKLKSSVRNSVKWIKSKFSDVRYGFGNWMPSGKQEAEAMLKREQQLMESLSMDPVYDYTFQSHLWIDSQVFIYQ